MFFKWFDQKIGESIRNCYWIRFLSLLLSLLSKFKVRRAGKIFMDNFVSRLIWDTQIGEGEPQNGFIFGCVWLL
jgi:hypothetical protein